MQGILVASQPDEFQLLDYALKTAGMVFHSRLTIEQVLETWTEQPADFVLIALDGLIGKRLRFIQELRAISIAPIAVIIDQHPEETLTQIYLAGVDLILIRPVSLRLLPHQIRPLLIRSNSMALHGLPELTLPPVCLDARTRTVVVGDHPPVHLTQLEFRLMYTLMIHSGQVISAEDIVSLVWGYHGEENRELVRGLIQRLRSKVEPNPQEPRFILTEPGIGYRFEPRDSDG